MNLQIITHADEELYQAFQCLMPQLTNNAPPPSREDLSALVNDSASHIIVARNDENKIIAALTLVIYHVPSGLHSIIEDVIVDESARGKGIGATLMNRAIELAKEKGASNISLTSNPMRQAANKLYIRTGFQKRETNAYLLKI